MTLTMCTSYWRDVILNLYPVDAREPMLQLWHDNRLSMHFTPFDWVNTAAKVMIVGITPGAYQATEALREVQACLQQGLSTEEALRRADATAAFSGPMRKNLVTMLDGIGLATALGLDSTTRLFDTHHHLAAHVSAIDFPVFRDSENYRGSPAIARHPVLRALVRASLGARIAMVSEDALIISLGTTARDAVSLLAFDGLVDRCRCLLGLPHPSGGNGHRVAQYTTRREALARDVEIWASSRQ